jgi:16S rRNA (adenine1518-N6/adenine1519-N6)-dimethyltransferase
MSLKQSVHADLAAAGCAPLHRYGQNFMIDARALDALVAALALSPGERVVEIGPGTGILTERLLAAGATVLAVEIDKGLAAHVARRFAGRDIVVEHGDALLTKNRLHPAIEAFASAGPWKLGANLPYDIALPALLCAVGLVGPTLPPVLAAVTVQWEAAQRLCAAPGAEAWGASAAVIQAAGSPSLVKRLAPASFYPQPRVDSAILTWRPLRNLPEGFSRWCRAVFAARRKVLPRALRDAGATVADATAAIAGCGLDPARRLETLSPDELSSLFARLPP